LLGPSFLAASCAFAADAETLADFTRIFADLATAELDFESAVDATGVELPIAHGSFSIEAGVLVPARTPNDPRVREAVFAGRGKLRFAPPDPVEIQQLLVRHGAPALDVTVDRAVLVLADGSLADEMAGRAKVAVAGPSRSPIGGLYEEWARDAEREGFGAEVALVRAVAGDPVGERYLAVWFDSVSLGRLFYSVDPSQEEAVRFGTFELFADEDFKTQWRKKRDRRHARDERRRARKQGPSLSDAARASKADSEKQRCGAKEEEEDEEDHVPWVRTWVETRLPGLDPDAEPAGVEPEHYTIDVDLTEEQDGLRAEITTRLHLVPNTDGLTVVTMRLGPKLEVCEVSGPDGDALPFERRDWEVLIALPEPTVADEPFELEVRTAGFPIDHWLDRRVQHYSLGWYPLAGRLNRATYDVTLRWPSALALLASGSVVGQGEADGRRWTRRTLDVPTMGFSYEIDDYETFRDQVGHIALTFGFHRRDPEMTTASKEEIVRTVKASLLFFESRFGLLPIDEMTVVSVRRGYSQGLLGFVTLTEGQLHARPYAAASKRTGQEVRLELIAHEIAHQWWGHVVGWDSYRDQWLSEALADFSAAGFMARIASRPEVYQRKRAEMTRQSLSALTFDGRPLASLGSVLLGGRISQGYGTEAYSAIVYDKGAATFTALTERLGTDETWTLLGNLTRAVANRVIRTSTFFKALERMSGQDLGGFVEQYVTSAGLPALFYDYRAVEAESGWAVEARVRQLPPAQNRHVLQRTGTGWDVRREVAPPADVAGWLTPFSYALDLEGGGGQPAESTGKLTAHGEWSTFTIPAEGKPARFVIDPEGRVLALVHAQGEAPERYRCEMAEHLIRLGRVEEGLELLPGPQPEVSRDRETEARAQLLRARAKLDAGQVEEARQALRAAEDRLPRDSDYLSGERAVLWARCDSSRGLHEAALSRLSTYLSVNALDLEMISRPDLMLDSSRFTRLQINRGEVLALLAVGAHEEGDPDAPLLIRVARMNGVDMRALESR
jgi:hypothetical protein